MDGIKKKPNPVPKDLGPKIFYPDFSGKEDIFISKNEARLMEEHEKTFRKGALAKKILWTIFVLIALSAISWTAFFSWKTYAVSKKIISIDSQNSVSQYARTVISTISSTDNGSPLKGELDGRINVLLLGAAGEHKPGGNLTDTVMVMSLDTENNKVALLSLPRDFYVPIADTKTYSKINSIYQIGIREGEGARLIKETVEKVLNIPINYYVVINFDGFEKIIDDIGGINIISDIDIYDTRYPGPNYSYETFELSKGFHKLDGATALKYVRERHSDSQGDFGRAKRQQQVIQAVKDKVFSAGTLLNVVELNNILSTLGDNVKTDIALEDMVRFIALSKKADLQNVTNVVADAWQKNSLLKVSHIMSGNIRAFILVPRVGNYSELQDLAQNIFNQDEIEKRRDAISEEDAKIAIINQSEDFELPFKIQSLLKEKLQMKKVSIVPNYSGNVSNQTKVASNSETEKIFTLDELIKKLPARIATPGTLNISSGDTVSKNDIIVVLGSDLIDAYKYEEDSMEDLENAEQDN